MQPTYYGAAAQYNKPTGGFPINRRLLLVIGLVIVVLFVLIIAISAISSVSQGPQNDFATLVAREDNLQTLIDKQKSNIQNGDFVIANTNANILLTSDLAALKSALKSVFSLDAVPDVIAQSEADPTTNDTLKKASQNGNFDSTYLGILKDKLASTYSLTQKVLEASSSQTLKKALNKTMSDLSTVDKQLSAIQL